MGVSTSPEFRAPPPSPVGSHHRRRGANQDILSEFLDKYSGHGIPNLVLPNYDKGEALLFPNKQRFLVNLPTFDFRLLSLHDLLDAVSDIGCFQLINHGVPQATLTRALENYTILDDENTEEIVVYKDVIDDDHHFKAEGHVCNYSEIIRELMGEAERIGKVIVEKLGGKCNQEDDDDQEEEEEEGVRVCYVKKHNHRKKQTEEEEAIRMMMMMMRRGYDERHSLCLNFCDETEFHVYSKLRGLVSFSTLPDAVVVTLGDHHHHHHAWNGVFKGVFGRPFLLNNCHHHLHQRDLVSLSFLYTSSGIHNNNKKEKEKRKKKKIISISQQLLFTLFFILFLPFFFP
ncbi:unnamed protein product [Cochlearia groenlandica]